MSGIQGSDFGQEEEGESQTRSECESGDEGVGYGDEKKTDGRGEESEERSAGANVTENKYNT